MQREFKKFKIKMNKKVQNFTRLVSLFLKLGFVTVLIFFVVLFLIGTPSKVVNDLFSTSNNFSFNAAYMSEDEFIHLLTPYAKQVEETHGTRPSILIAQAALESDWGNSTLSRDSNNYFGIKDPNGTQYATKEFYNNEWESIQASFKYYDSLEASIVDYANLITHGTSWDSNLYYDAIEATNYKDAAYALQKAGYATDPTYADKLIHLIEQHHLYEIDR